MICNLFTTSKVWVILLCTYCPKWVKGHWGWKYRGGHREPGGASALAKKKLGNLEHVKTCFYTFQNTFYTFLKKNIFLISKNKNIENKINIFFSIFFKFFKFTKVIGISLILAHNNGPFSQSFYKFEGSEK